MNIINNGIVFRDVPGGGYYCNTCKVGIHPDMVPSHKHWAPIVSTKSGEQATLRKLAPERIQMDNKHIEADEVELTFTDLVQLVRKEYSNERDNIGYNRAALIVDKALLPYIAERERLARIDELENYSYDKTENWYGENEELLMISGRITQLTDRLDSLTKKPDDKIKSM